MIATIAVLDDDPISLKTIEKSIEKFNRFSPNTLYPVFFSDPDELFRNFRYDIVLLDVDLGPGKQTGFDLARKILKEHSDTTVLVMSADITESDTESLLSKCVLRISEVFLRYWQLRNNPNKNVLQIFVRGAEFDGRNQTLNTERHNGN